jgi:hypothetical protein
MKILLILSSLLLIAPSLTFADFGDGIAKMIFEKKVDQIYQKALLCSPMEKDHKASLDVTDWIKIQPALPSWQMLADIETVAKEARKYAQEKSSNDKIRHCFAGCYVANKLDYKSAVLVGWFKELVDTSDCSKTTSFEKRDYDATIKGARAGSQDKDCESFCKK